MSYRHHLALLESQTATTATYRFTPDSITKMYWGRVEFDRTTYEPRVIEEPPDPEHWGWPLPTVCKSLALKFKEAMEAGAPEPPSKLLWIS